MTVLGVDPGSNSTGYCIIESQGGSYRLVSHGIIKPKGSYPERLKELYNAFYKVVDNFSPSALAVEGIFHGRNFKTALKLGEVRGILILAAVQKGLEVFEYPPSQVKENLVGYGSATKEQVRYIVSQMLGKSLPSLDESDAAAVALCHIMREKGFDDRKA